MKKGLLFLGVTILVLGVLALLFSGLCYILLHGTSDATHSFYHGWFVRMKIARIVGVVLALAGIVCLLIRAKG